MHNPYAHTRFLLSAAEPGQSPPDQGREVAFAGRSNAGKSSALNALTGQKALARTSKTPGRTQLLNFFEVDDGMRLVDLPGYGYAKVSGATRARWQRSLAAYLEQRRSLAGLILLMDIRHPLTDYDRQLLGWAREAGLPVHVLLTKADKLRRGAAKTVLLQVQRRLEADGLPAGVQLFSALKKEGLEEVWSVLDAWLER